MELNVISVTFNGFSKATTCGLYQWDYGQFLKAEDIELPQSYEVHFAQGTDTCTVLGDAYVAGSERQYSAERAF